MRGPVQHYPGVETIHGLFEEQVRLQPGRGEVRADGRSTSFFEVNADANRLAGLLVERGIVRGDLVGVCLDPSVELVVSLLAVLKAGAAFVPLDPTHPQDRITHVVRDAATKAIICNGGTSHLCPNGAVGIVLDTIREELADKSAANPDVPVAADDVIYVMYTSGSTGLPKGAILSHRGIRNRLLWGIEEYELGRGDAVLFKTSIAFDVCIWEIFAPLLSGANLVIAPQGRARDVSFLSELIRAESVTHADFVPSMMAAFLSELEPGHASSLRVITCAGEALTAALLEKILDALPVRVYNLYGPTEASLAVTWWACSSAPQDGQVPIGRPMSNVVLHVLGPDGEPVTGTESGELYIGGVAPGLGYLNLPERTAAAFPPDRFTGEGLMYRTGDLVRVRDDGEIMFLGRFDDQVKLRGMRLELGEVEAQVASNPLVRDAVVLLREFGEDDQRLVTYITLRAGLSPADANPETLALLRKPLKASLPANVVPTHFVLLDKLPLTTNGKADRQLLASLPVTRAALTLQALASTAQARSTSVPDSHMEKRMCRLWAEVLGAEQVGIHDDFFDLGGHSLLAVKLIARMRKELGVKIPIGTLFEQRTIGRLVLSLAEAGGESSI
ncbi:amino acid adenylation domain-containing protein [Sphingomonas sp. NCPPB 2930]